MSVYTAPELAAGDKSVSNQSTRPLQSGADTSNEPILTAGVGTWLLKNIWYYAVPAESLKRGKTVTKIMLGEPLLIGRDSDGKPFAMRDICPHQGVPLSKGGFDGQKVSCCFHGWCFDTKRRVHRYSVACRWAIIQCKQHQNQVLSML